MSKTYLDNNNNIIHILNDASFVAKKCEITAITGESGSGKSTFLNILGLLDSEYEGLYEIDGIDHSKNDKKLMSNIRGKTIGFIFQDSNLFDYLNVRENVELAMLKSKASKKEIKLMIESSLKNVGMSHRINSFPKTLSGGEKQRVAVARCIVKNPKIILADEPTGNIDIKNKIKIMEIFRELANNGRTIVLVSHSEMVLEYADAHYKLKNGKLVKQHVIDR